MLSLDDALLGLGLPALVGMVIYWLLWRRMAGVASGVAISLGFATGYCGLHGLPKLLPAEALEWLALAAVAMAIIIAVDQFFGRTKWIGVACQLALIAVTDALIVWLIAKNGWSIFETLGWIAGSCIAAGVLLVGLTTACEHNIPNAVTIGLSVLTIFAAAVIGMSGSQPYGMQAATIPAVLVPLAAISIWRRAALFTSSSMAAFVLLYSGMLLCGYLYINLTIVNGVLLLVAPLGLFAGSLPAFRKFTSWQRALIAILGAVIPGAIAFGLALHRFLIDMSDSLPF
jgi:hypothetical protein